MSVIVTTPQGDITHPDGVRVEPFDDKSLQVWSAPGDWPEEVLAAMGKAADDGHLIGYYQPGAWTRVRVETMAAAETTPLTFGPGDGVWQIPDPGPLDAFPSPADLQPHIDALQTMAKEMAKVADLGGEARTAYQLQQVAVALWLGLDPAVVSNLSVHYGAKSGSEEVAAVDYLAIANAVGTRPSRRPHTPLQYTIRTSLAHDDMIEVSVDLDPAQTRALRALVGYPIPRPFPVIGKQT